MSADFRPIDFMITQMDLRLQGKTDDFMMEHPYLEYEIDGKIYPMNNKECCEKYPYASFFCQDINNKYEELKNNEKYIEGIKALNQDFHDILYALWDSIETEEDGRYKIVCENPFANISNQFPDIEDFVMAKGEYAFSYNSRVSHKRFTDHFFHQIGLEKEMEDREEDLER